MSDKNYKHKLQFNTLTVHAGLSADPVTGAVMTPIYQTSTYAQSDVGGHKGYEYSRTKNPTRTSLQEALGGGESLIELPAPMTHASVADSHLAIDPGLVRLSFGIEDAQDLIADLQKALQLATNSL